MDNIDQLTNQLGCRMDNFPTVFMEPHLGALFESVSAWDEVEERLKTIFAS